MGIFYPDKLPQSKWLNFYSERLNTLELNVTFYRFPTIKGLQDWYQKSPEDFLFSVKAPQEITHVKQFNDCADLIAKLYEVCKQGLKDKLGGILFQLPPSVSYSDEMLEQIISSLNPDFKNVVEFRHKSWWTQKVYDALAEKNIIFCSVSHPNLPSTIVENTTTAYIRLHGIPKMFYSNYSPEFLTELKAAIAQKSKLEEVFVYFNNTASTAGITNAQQFHERI